MNPAVSAPQKNATRIRARVTSLRRSCRGLLAAMGTGLLLTACSESEVAAPPPPPVEQVPARMEEAFQDASPEVKTLAEATVTAVKSEDPEALLQLQELRGRPDLTPAQRTAANQSMYAVLARLNAAAINGDNKAVEALQRYQSLK